ncbi:TldD/PmbA family protein [Methanobacterium alcaliphilum]|uniref:TldD/PmbA family protein n=1 Tax=Methanobacterium alcaliphilum TaxID=392018 RepID=UPI00200A2A14|nr:TldD/PmbA family protein [Methanobacterium alcaliphilum]MCK9150920.1 TldD/PmbA family protein [Methanobacterium alcaliphilum]
MKNQLDLDFFRKIIHSLEKEADYIDIRAGTGNNTSILMKDGKIQEIKSGFDRGGRVRVLKDGAWGFAFTNDLSKLDEIGNYALKLAQSLKSDIELAPYEPVVSNIKSPAKIPPSEVSTEEKKDLIKEANYATNIEKVVSTTVNYVDMEGSTIFMSSEGASIHMDESRVGMFLNAVASSGEVIQFGHGSMGGARGFEVLKNADIEKFGRKIGEKAVRLLSASTPPSGKFPVVTDCELTGVFIHEALGHAAEADLILQNDSILKNKMDTQIGSNLVTIIDDASMDAFGYYAYDSEGVKTKENVLVKEGVLKSLLSSRETASKLNLQPSGNARSIISEQPIVRMSNTYLKPGELTFNELLEDIKDGIYLKGSRGGQVDTGKGIFQFNAAESFKIENGEIKEPLRDVSLSGNIMETLKSVDGVGSDFKMSIGFCGKSGQTAPVGDGGPHVRIQDAMVGGAM